MVTLRYKTTGTFQTYHVAITWSGADNSVMFCLTSQGDASQLHLAAQQFMSFYYHILSNLVAVPLNGHVTNITLHQYHRATYAVKKLHSKAMIKGKIIVDVIVYLFSREMDAARKEYAR